MAVRRSYCSCCGSKVSRKSMYELILFANNNTFICLKLICANCYNNQLNSNINFSSIRPLQKT